MPSGSYALRRGLQAIGTLFIIVTLLFFLFRLGLPDPTAALVTQGFSPEDRALLRERFGLDRPLFEQYLLYLRNIVQGDFGTSFYYNAPVADINSRSILQGDSNARACDVMNSFKNDATCFSVFILNNILRRIICLCSPSH